MSKIANPDANWNTDIEFTKEIYFLSDIVPAIRDFEEIENFPQAERINNAFPQYFGSRLSLNSSKIFAKLYRINSI